MDIESSQPIADAQISPVATAVSASAEAQLEQIIREHASAVRDILIPRYRGGLDRSDIDDVVAVAAHRLWLHRAEFSRLRSPRAWFVRIADNVARDVLRYGWQKARQLEVAAEKSYLESFPPAAEAAGDAEVPNASAAPPPRAELIRDLVGQLPEKQRKIVWADALSRSGNIAAEDLANELDIPTGTVRVYRKRALDRLRKLLTEHGFAPDAKP